MFENFEQFKNEMKGKRVTVAGIGISNKPLIKLLAGCGAYVTACDKKGYEKLGDIAAELEELGVVLKTGETYLDGIEGDFLFRSPGIRPDLPQFVEFEQKGGILTSEMEVFFDVCPIKLIAVTGSDGKTTTTTLISKLLENAGKKVHIGGNIGRPLLCDVPDFDDGDIAVVELSSFQLMTMKKSPSVAVITNISPNHLDVHKDMDEYIESKKNIMKYQSENDLLVLNYDNDLTREIGKEAIAKTTYFSRRDKKDIYLCDGVIYDSGEPVMKAEDIVIPGIHNIENYMAAYAAVKNLISPANLISVAKKFKGVEHRIEFVREVGGIKFYNDSIASSPTRAQACLNAFFSDGIKIKMIAGGYDKHIPFDELGEEIVKKAKKLYLCGNTAPKIKLAVKNADKDFPVEERDSFNDIVELAYKEAEQGDIIVLCPACASFDKFANFEQRGNCFKQIVNEL